MMLLLVVPHVVGAPPDGQQIQPTTPYGASVAPPQTISGLCRGYSMTARVQLINFGTLTWLPSAVHLAYHWYPVGTVPPGTVPSGPPPDFGAVVFNGARTILPGPVHPKDRITVEANLQAPPAAGTYALKWDMVQEGVTWFSRQGVPTTDQQVRVLSLAECLVNRVQGTESLPPTITGPMPVGGTQPGMFVLVTGSNFGLTPGRLLLTLRDAGGMSREVPIEQDHIKGWTDSSVFAITPENIVGVPDQTAALTLFTHRGLRSNIWGVTFSAARDMLWDPGGAIKLIACDGTSDVDECDADYVEGHHWSNLSLGYTGFDEFSLGPLVNGWSVDSHIWIDRENVLGDPLGLEATAPTRYHVNWHIPAGLDETVSYFVAFIIVGPKGVPYR
jgi:hypothetical protein